MITFGNLDFEVGNMTYVAMQEELIESVINDFVDNVFKYWGGKCSTADVINMLVENDIDYEILPQYLKDKIDTINVYQGEC